MNLQVQAYPLRLIKPSVSFAIITVCAGVLLTTPGGAAEKKPKTNVSYNSVSLTATAGGLLFAGSEHLRATPLYGIKLSFDKVGFSVVDSLGIEGTYNYLSTKSTRDSKDVQGHLFRLDAIYPFIPRGKLVPFVVLGAGGIDLITAEGSDIDPLLNYGGGIKYFFEDFLAIRTDLRHLLVYSHAHTRSNVELTVGLTYYFGKERKKKPAPPTVPAPNQKAGLKTEITQAAAGAKTPAAPVWQTEGSLLDKIGMAGGAITGVIYPAPQSVPALAPLTPVAPDVAAKQVMPGDGAAVPVAAYAPVPNSGAAPHVIDSSGPLASVPAEVPVPVQPPIEQIISEITRIEFDRGSSWIRPEYYQDLINLSMYLKAYPKATAIIEGHGDSYGSLELDQQLSQQRAESVKQKLVLFGILPNRILTGASGATEFRSRGKKYRTIITITPFLKSSDE